MLRALMLTSMLLLGAGACAPTAPGSVPPSSPGAAYEPPAPAGGGGAGAPDGASCLTAADCSSGTCEGQGCGADAPGLCVAAARACTRDLQTYCGCDGVDFGASGSCPGQRYASRGGCAAAATP